MIKCSGVCKVVGLILSLLLLTIVEFQIEWDINFHKFGLLKLRHIFFMYFICDLVFCNQYQDCFFT